jgi:hypothetical protein
MSSQPDHPIPQRARTGLYITLIGWAIVALPLALAFGSALGLQPHPAIWSSEPARRILDWCDRHDIFLGGFLGGWALVITGYCITGQALSDEPNSRPQGR